MVLFEHKFENGKCSECGIADNLGIQGCYVQIEKAYAERVLEVKNLQEDQHQIMEDYQTIGSEFFKALDLLEELVCNKEGHKLTGQSDEVNGKYELCDICGKVIREEKQRE